ncbi:MAG TPA: TROVE domain-containing protein, partial [Micromonosporaceae bacterium]|nr:TROVE domain-containing protein [Micromonosporaceae bacterium]
MSKFGKLASALHRHGGGAISPVTVVGPGLTHEGGTGYQRDAKSDLFLLAVTNFVGEDTFYEKASERDARFRDLVATVTRQDPAWVARFVPWLRRTALMRSASIVTAVEYVRAGGPNGRRVIAAACERADEPAEVLAYWILRYGRAIPQPVKRGVADAAVRLYTEKAALKYDGGSRGWRMADVLELAHVRPRDAAQSDLFRWLLDRRHNRPDITVPESLATITAYQRMQAVPAAERRAALGPERLRASGMTWESVSGWIGGPMDAAVWQAAIPSMGYMATLRNLRNFDQAGVSDEVAAQVAARLADPDQVARSRQLPFRFWSAYRATDSARWTDALERALGAATRNIPAFTGRTLVLVDTSASMTSVAVSARSTVTPVQAAALFGVAMAARGNAVDLVGYADGTFRHRIRRGASVLREVERFVARVGEVGHGTRIAAALARSYQGHDRVVIVSDMQTFHEPMTVSKVVGPEVPVYGFNLGGYASTVIDAGGHNRHEFGGLSD